jgi:hypothetical protein
MAGLAAFRLAVRYRRCRKRGIISAEQGILVQKQGIFSVKSEIITGRGFRYTHRGCCSSQRFSRFSKNLNLLISDNVIYPGQGFDCRGKSECRNCQEHYVPQSFGFQTFGDSSANV